jgi:hypothetical protein
VLHRGHDGEPDRLLVQRPPGRRTPDPAAAARPGVAGARLGTLGWAAREQPHDRLGQPSLERQVLVGAPLPIPLAALAAHVLLGQALRFGRLQSRLLHQGPLPLIALAGAAEPDHHRRQAARLPGPAAQRRVAGQDDEYPPGRLAEAKRGDTSDPDWPQPQAAEVESARVLANDARSALRAAGLSDEDIDRLADDFIAEDRGEATERFIDWAVRARMAPG